MEAMFLMQGMCKNRLGTEPYHSVCVLSCWCMSFPITVCAPCFYSTNFNMYYVLVFDMTSYPCGTLESHTHTNRIFPPLRKLTVL